MKAKHFAAFFAGLATAFFLRPTYAQSQMLYWTDNTLGVIQRANLDGTGGTTLVSNLVAPNAIAFDPVNQEIYWIDGPTNQHFLKRANLDGSGVTTILSLSPNVRDGLAVDPGNERAYFSFQSSGGGADGIMSAKLDGSDLQTIAVGNASGPRGLTLDTVHQQIYWADILQSSIGRVNYDGTGVTTIFANPHYSSSPWAIDLNTINNRLYFTASTFIETDPPGVFGGVVTINQDGSDPQSLYTPSFSRRGLAVDELDGKLFWTEVQTIAESNLDGTGHQVVISNLTSPDGLVIVSVPEPASFVLCILGGLGLFIGKQSSLRCRCCRRFSMVRINACRATIQVPI